MSDKKREEQIKEAARQRADQYDHPSKWSDTYYGFIDGAKWAGQHPNWISVDENNLPPKLKGKQYTEYYFVYSSRGVQKMRYNYDRRDWQDECGMMFIAIQCVTHWMPLPQPPRKEE